MRNNHNKHNNGKKVEKRTEINLKEHLGKKVNVGVQDGKFIFAGPLSIGVFAEKINRPASEIIRYFFNQKKMYNVNVILNEEQIAELCLNYNLDFEKQQQIDATNIVENLVIDDDEKDLQPRAPIVTIMGHVDHGKTTLLDYIHKTNTVGKESGGITQHINAYQCKFKNFPITFIDTPGHEAFATMRTNGAKLTDIIVLVVAADDGIKPQTLESIKCAKETKTPVIVFINKMDKPNVNPEVVMNQLSDHGLVPEE
jgi:translation initiation factor IF-2